MLPLHFSKTSPKCGDAYSKSTFFVYPPERGEIGQSLPRLAHFTSSLHSDSRTKPLKPRDEPKFFSIFAIKKAVPRHNERLASERLLPVRTCSINKRFWWKTPLFYTTDYKQKGHMGTTVKIY